MRRSLIMMFAAASAIAAVAAPAGISGSITTESGDTTKGLIRWSARDKAYAITTKGGMELQVKATDVAEIDIAKPAGWDQIVAQVEVGMVYHTSLQRVFGNTGTLRQKFSTAIGPVAAHHHLIGFFCLEGLAV